MRGRNHRGVEALGACAAFALLTMAHVRAETLAVAQASPVPQTPQTTYTLDAHVISAGSTTRTTSVCYRMRSTIAEPAAGYSWSAHYTLKSGFTALRSTVPKDDIFFDGLEDCSP